MVRIGSRETEPSRREALLGVLLLWLFIPAFGAIPYVVTGGFSPLNAFFESMSGFTTTGATVLRDFGSFSSSLFMWRAPDPVVRRGGHYRAVYCGVAATRHRRTAAFLCRGSRTHRGALDPPAASNLQRCFNRLCNLDGTLRGSLRDCRDVVLRRRSPRLYHAGGRRVQP